MATGKLSFTDMQNPLLMDQPQKCAKAARDYRTWRRLFEIQLAAKRKPGFIDGLMTRNKTYVVEATQWDTCNSLVIF